MRKLIIKSKIKKNHKIDTIFCPAYEGGHQDHDVANFICSRLKKNVKFMSLLNIIFKNRVNSNNFFIQIDKDNVIFLTDAEKKEKKTLKIYKSESSNLNYINFEKNLIENYMSMTINPHLTRVFLFYRRFFFLWMAS